jgi:hypothetical protein
MKDIIKEHKANIKSYIRSFSIFPWGNASTKGAMGVEPNSAQNSRQK